MQTLRIFISSPGDVFEERAKARQVIEQLQRYYGTRVKLVPLLWEELPLGVDASFQNGIDLVLSEKMRVDIAIFILWSRLGSPLGPPTSKLNGDPYLSGTEREMDLMLQARQQGDGKSPHIIAYVRRDDESFNASLDAKKSDESLEELITQRKRARQFVEEVFQDDEGHNVRAFHSYDKPLSFAGRLKVHLRALIDELLGSEVPEGAQWEDSPYRGLHVFDVCHAPIFFGREQEICDLELLLRKRESDGSAFAVIVGASGSGKSSLARAGLAANLLEGNLDETVQQWRIATLMPGAAQGDLLGCLVRNLAEVLPELTSQGLAAEDLSAEWARNPLGVVKMAILPAFHRAAESAKGTVKMVLILDQLEELWTDPRIEPAKREAFLAAVEALAGSGRVWVLATLRTDFYPIAQLSEAFLKLKGRDGHFDLVPPGPASIHRIITEPARLAGLSFEKDSRSGQGLDQTLLKDAVNQPDALPLLEYALDQLYQARDEKGELSFAAYQQMGGVEGALGRKAETEFGLLPQDVQGAFAEVFHHLVTVDEDGAGNASRRTAFLSEVTDTPGETSLVAALTAQRLLATDREGDVPVIRIAHEALLRRWERLVRWVQSNREYLRLRSRVEHARTRWAQEGGNSSLLLSEGLPLEEGRRLLNEVPGLLDAPTLEFIRSSVRHHEALSQRKRRTRRLVMAGLAALTVLALLGAAASAWQWRQTSRERDAKQGEFNRAEQEKERAELAGFKSRQSAADLHVDNAARSIDAGRWGDAAIHLAAAWLNDSKSEEANLLLPIALRQLEGNSHSFQAHQDLKVSALAVSPDGKWLASGCESGEVRIRDAASESILQEFKDHKVEVRSLYFHQAAGGPMRLASVGTDFRLYVYDVENGKPLYRYTDHTDDVYGAVFHPSGKLLLTWSEDSTLVIHDLVRLKSTVVKTSDNAPFRFAGWTHGGDQILAVQASGATTIWDSSGKVLRDLPAAGKEDDVRCASLDPSGHWLALGLAKGDIRFVDAEGGKTVEILRGDPSPPLDLKFHFQPEPLLQGREGLLFLHVARANGNLERWRPHFNRQDSAFHYQVLHSSESQGPTATDLTGNGEFYSVTDVSGGLRLYHAPSGRILNQANAHKDGCFSLVSAPDGQTWWTGGAHGEIRKWTVPGRCIPAHKDGIVTMAVDPQERFILTGGHDGLARLWEISTGKMLRELAHAPGSYSVQAVDFDMSGKHCLTAGGTEVRVWDLGDPSALPKVIQVESPHWISDAKFTGEDSQVVLAVQTYQEQDGADPLKTSDGDGWRLCSIQDGKEIRRIDDVFHVSEVIPNRDGLRIFSRSRDFAYQHGITEDLWFNYPDATSLVYDDSGYFLNGYLNGEMHLYSLSHEDRFWTSPPTGSRMGTVDLDVKGGLALGGDEAGNLQLVDLKDGRVKFTIGTGFSAVAKALAPSDSKFVIAGGRNGELAFWDRNTGRKLITWGRHSQAVHDVRYLAKIGRCVTASSDGRLWIQECGWSAEDPLSPDEVFARVASAIASPDGLPASHSETPEVTTSLEGLRSSFPQSADTKSSR